jgi:hypothetical protein
MVAGWLSGCATPADPGQMIARPATSAYVVSTPLRNNIAIRDVTGGKETNPLWTSQVGSSEFEQALEASLRAAGLLSPGRQAGNYVLTAHLQRLEQPYFGASMTVTASVNYILAERATGRALYDKTLEVPYTAKFSDALLGVERLRLANEGAIRANISTLIEELLRISLDGSGAPAR